MSKLTNLPDRQTTPTNQDALFEALIKEMRLVRENVEALAAIQREMLTTQDNMLYTTDQVAQLIAPSTKKGKPVSDTTVLRWIKQGLIVPIPGTHYRISGKEIKRFVGKYYGGK